MSDDAPTNAERERLECLKLQAECDKLRVETAELRIAWYKRPAYAGALIPVVLGVFGLVSAWATGVFDAQRAELRAEKDRLAAEIDTLKQAESIVRQEYERLKADNEAIRNQIDHGYVQLNVALGKADYALKHVEHFDQEFRQQLERASQDDGQLPPGARAALDSLRARFSDKTNLLRSAMSDVGGARQSLEAIPATPWARAVRYDPEHGATHPDGTLYEPSTRPTARPPS